MVSVSAAAGANPDSDRSTLARTSSATAAALRVEVTGVVQGVGFRPFVHRLANRHGLTGWVRNAAGDVQLMVQGSGTAIESFLAALKTEAPPLARIESLTTSSVPAAPCDEFVILPSLAGPDRRQPVPPDAAICPACERELFDPADRRHRYPFITCTDCGPRFTIIEALPYDRERTSMRGFPQCPACALEYSSPDNRRFHSETNSCSACGPRLWFQTGRAGVRREGDAGLAEAVRLLRRAGILALRGLGGFHLAVEATSEEAVVRLRGRKQRDAKPLAVMVQTVGQARSLGVVGAEEADILCSAERPVVVLRRRADAPLANAIAPGLDTIGVLLAATPLHHLLLQLSGRPLVMTSGNVSEEPIAIGNEEALRRLGAVADGFLLHNREIVARYDDSVVRLAATRPILLRRARGYAPLPLELPVPSPRPLLAVGPHLKNTFTLAHGVHAFVSQHIGDLGSLETLEHFQHALLRLRQLFQIAPEVAVRDLHPGYLSTRIAEELKLERVIPVQHHHAHVAAVLAEHGRTGPAIGIAYDGTGYGDDGNTWGSEILLADLVGYHRAGRLRYAPMPGGDAAARAPWRAALGFLSLEPAVGSAFRLAGQGVSQRERATVEQQLTARFHTPLVSSMGRLFDAAASVLGIRQVNHYEGQAAMELESLAGQRPGRELPWGLGWDGEAWVLDPLPLLKALDERIQRGESAGDLAADFHETIAIGTAEIIGRVSQSTALRTVALAGGVFQNARLLASLQQRLENLGLEILFPARLGPNDGAVSYGQAAVAAALLSSERRG